MVIFHHLLKSFLFQPFVVKPDTDVYTEHFYQAVYLS